jgi:hypothetical protein
MKPALFSILCAFLVCLSGCSTNLVADQSEKYNSQMWGVELFQRDSRDLILTMRILNLSSRDQLCPAVDDKGRFYGVINIVSSAGSYKLVHREKYQARVSGVNYSNRNPILIKGMGSEYFTVNIRRDYVSINAPYYREEKWIEKAIQNRAITMNDRVIYNDWWNELKNDREWAVNASFIYLQTTRKISSLFARHPASFEECLSKNVKIKLGSSQ